jgi:hypothetical protein
MILLQCRFIAMCCVLFVRLDSLKIRILSLFVYLLPSLTLKHVSLVTGLSQHNDITHNPNHDFQISSHVTRLRRYISVLAVAVTNKFVESVKLGILGPYHQCRPAHKLPKKPAPLQSLDSRLHPQLKSRSHRDSTQ